jgi:hypothetical protein
MDCRRLEPVFLNHTGRGLDLNPSLKTPSEVDLNIVRSNVTDRSIAERLFEMLAGAFVG